MECCCNTYNESKKQFLDINGVRYLISILDRVIEQRDKDVLKTAKRYTDNSVNDLRIYTIEQIAKLREELKQYVDEKTAEGNYLTADDIFLDGNILKIRKPDGTYIEIDLTNVIGGSANLVYAEIADIDAMFDEDRPVIII